MLKRLITTLISILMIIAMAPVVPGGYAAAESSPASDGYVLPEEGTYVCTEAELPPSLSYMSDDLKLQSESSGLYETGFVCFYDYVNMASYGPHRGVLIFEDPEEYSAHYVLEPSDITFTDVRGTLKIRK